MRWVWGGLVLLIPVVNFLSLGYLVVLVYAFWNIAYLQGNSGQSIGKRAIGLRVVREGGRPRARVSAVASIFL